MLGFVCRCSEETWYDDKISDYNSSCDLAPPAASFLVIKKNENGKGDIRAHCYLDQGECLVFTAFVFETVYDSQNAGCHRAILYVKTLNQARDEALTRDLLGKWSRFQTSDSLTSADSIPRLTGREASKRPKHS